MTQTPMNSLERVLTTLGHQEADRTPFFLLLTMHGAKELGLSIQEYFSNPEAVAEGQLRLRKKFRHDCFNSFFYAPIEIEAWGAEVIYRTDGPPNSGEPFLRKLQDIQTLKAPSVKESPCLQKVLKATELMKARSHNDVPIIGVVMSPFSLPVMQMGFAKYLELLYTEPALFNILMQINEDFCVEWANAQLDAGATAICYFDPISSSSMIPRELYLRTGHEVAKKTLCRIHGPGATHLASGRVLPIIDDIVETGTAVLGCSCEENLREIKNHCRGKLSVLGNLNGIEMARWTAREAEDAVKRALAAAAPGGGFILSDAHGEIPFQVPDEVLSAISEAVYRWGRYPLDWIAEYE